LVSGVVGALLLLGVVAHVAVSTMIKQMQRDAAAEAEANVTAIVNGVEARFAALGTLPPSISPTPPLPAPVCGPRAWPPDAPAGWGELAFAPRQGVLYAYSIETAPDGRRLVVHAVGDLDCDGVAGRVDQSVALASEGRLVVGRLHRRGALEE
jgi:hypothetical protein